MFLSFQEYREFDPTSELTQVEYTNLYNRAEMIISVHTRRFYEHVDFETDHEFRKNAYKKAIAYQIHHFNEVGTTSYEGMSNRPTSISVGRTSINYGSAYNRYDDTQTVNLLSLEASMALSGTGLLYRGVNHLC